MFINVGNDSIWIGLCKKNIEADQELYIFVCIGDIFYVYSIYTTAAVPNPNIHDGMPYICNHWCMPYAHTHK